MNAMLLKALLALVPVSMLLLASAVTVARQKTAFTLMQLVGATSLLLVVFAHICEATRLFPAMHWGEEHSVGHYLDLAAAVLGLTLFPLGYLLHALSKRSSVTSR
jgi:uncharacterized membrane protein